MPSRSDPQLNVRLDQARREVLDAAAFVHGTTAARLIQELAEGAIAGYEKRGAVQKALEARREQAAIDKQTLTHIQPVRTRKQPTRGSA